MVQENLKCPKNQIAHIVNKLDGGFLKYDDNPKTLQRISKNKWEIYNEHFNVIFLKIEGVELNPPGYRKK